jgi:hypothetical protein
MSNQTFPKKYSKLIPDLIEPMSSAGTDELKQKILEAEGNIYEIENAKMADEALLKAKEHSKELAASYKESRAIEIAKIQLALYILEDRGVNL